MLPSLHLRDYNLLFSALRERLCLTDPGSLVPFLSQAAVCVDMLYLCPCVFLSWILQVHSKNMLATINNARCEWLCEWYPVRDFFVVYYGLSPSIPRILSGSVWSVGFPAHFSYICTLRNKMYACTHIHTGHGGVSKLHTWVRQDHKIKQMFS